MAKKKKEETKIEIEIKNDTEIKIDTENNTENNTEIESNTKEKEKVKCIFCDQKDSEVGRLVAGPPGIFICDECIKLCGELLEDEEYDDEIQLNFKNLPKPKELKEYLDEHIVGQLGAKKQLSVAVYNHYKRILSDNKEFGKKDDIKITKSNVFLIGPTGTGKTLLAQTLAKKLNVPFVIVDATTLTQAGYVGEDPENILLRLIKEADWDVEKAQKGIIYIDEIDKISRKGENVSITRDVSGEGVQQSLLKIIEGTIAAVPPQGGRKHPMQETIPMDTSDILFICGGSFDGLEKIVQKRLGKSEIGLGSRSDKIIEDKNNIFKNVRSVDLMKFGLIPEFVGRVPVIAKLQKLDVEDMVKVLTEPKNAIIKQYKKLMKIDGIKLEFADDAIEYIAQEVIKSETGARGLRSLLEEIMQEAMCELPGKKGTKTQTYIITKDMIEQVLSVA